MGAMGWTSRIRNKGDRGASLIEFAFIAPFLILLLLGIIEFGYFLGERNELKHGAHEGARLAAVNDADPVAGACNAMNLPGTATAEVTLVDGTSSSTQAADGAGAIGDQASITVEATIGSLSGLGLIEVFLPSTVKASADFRLEQPSDWTDTTQQPCP